MKEEYFMREVYVKITTKSLNKPINSNDTHSEPMLLKNFQKVIDELPASVKTIYVCGGDPCLIANLRDYLAYGKKLGEVALIVDGSDKQSLEKYKKTVSELHITLKYPHQELQDSWNKNNGNFKRLCDALLWAKKNEVKSFIRWEIDTLNYPYLFHVIKMCKDYGSRLYLYRSLPRDNDSRKFFISEGVWDIFCNDVRSNCDFVPLIHVGKNDMKNCGGGISEMMVLPDGRVTLSHQTREYVGNLLEESYSTIKKKLDAARVEYSKCKNCPCIVEAKKIFVQPEKVESLVSLP